MHLLAKIVLYHNINLTKSFNCSILTKFYFLKAVLLKFPVFWDVMICWVIVIGVLKDCNLFQLWSWVVQTRERLLRIRESEVRAKGCFEMSINIWMAKRGNTTWHVAICCFLFYNAVSILVQKGTPTIVYIKDIVNFPLEF